jgi:prevent-host-death family protein
VLTYPDPFARWHYLLYDNQYDYRDRVRGSIMARRTEAWTVADAKARLSEVIDRALSDGPQIITRNGRRAVVVVASEEWERKTKRKGNLAEFFAASPLRDSGLAVERTKDGPREIAL